MPGSSMEVLSTGTTTLKEGGCLVGLRYFTTLLSGMVEFLSFVCSASSMLSISCCDTLSLCVPTKMVADWDEVEQAETGVAAGAARNEALERDWKRTSSTVYDETPGSVVSPLGERYSMTYLSSRPSFSLKTSRLIDGPV